jgi:hypothetical protein
MRDSSMRSSLLIAAASGFASALLFASGTTGTALGAVLMALSPLPLYIAGLGYGNAPALMACAVGTGLTAAAIGGQGPLSYAIFGAIPAYILTRLTLLNRPLLAQTGGTGPVSITPNPGPSQQASVEWYPIGIIIAVAAIMAGASTGLILIAGFGTQEAYNVAVTQAVEPMFNQIFGSMTAGMPPEQAAQIRQRFLTQAAALLPAVLSITVLCVMLFNLWLGGKIAAASGNFHRPWLPLRMLTYPKWLAVLLLAAILLSRQEGFGGAAFTAITGALVFAYFILGAIVILALARGTGFFPAAVILLILSLILEPLALFIAGFGVLDSFVNFRARRRTAPPPSPSGAA